MATAAAPITRFRQAMQAVYGPFDDLPIEQCPYWTPPPNSGGHRGRYLWTDAFGVLNFLTLYKETSEARYLTLAELNFSVVVCVSEKTTLRVSMAMDTSGEAKYNEQAISLARAIHPHFFADRASPRPRMVWKVSVDLMQPLVASEGNLDPIDGHVMFRLLQAWATDTQALHEEVGDYKKVMERKGKHFVSTDMLDLGMTLWTSQWLAGTEAWADGLMVQCIEQLHTLIDEERYLDQSMRRRLAFREFGTVLGIKCTGQEVHLLGRAEAIISAWEKVMENETPDDLRPITLVMYAAALTPGVFQKGYLGQEQPL